MKPRWQYGAILLAICGAAFLIAAAINPLYTIPLAGSFLQSGASIALWQRYEVSYGSANCIALGAGSVATVLKFWVADWGFWLMHETLRWLRWFLQRAVAAIGRMIPHPPSIRFWQKAVRRFVARARHLLRRRRRKARRKMPWWWKRMEPIRARFPYVAATLTSLLWVGGAVLIGKPLHNRVLAVALVLAGNAIRTILIGAGLVQAFGYFR